MYNLMEKLRNKKKLKNKVKENRQELLNNVDEQMEELKNSLNYENHVYLGFDCEIKKLKELADQYRCEA